MKYKILLVGFLMMILPLFMNSGRTAYANTKPNVFSSTEHTIEYAFDDAAPSLYEQYADYFSIGSAINSWDIEDSASDSYKIVERQFDTVVYENQTKPDQIHPSEKYYKFEPTDKLVEWAEVNGKKVRGHTLVWHSQCPGWFFRDGAETTDADLLVQRMKDHITTIVSRYKGKIDTWDVVNEILDDSSGLRQSDWLNIIGDYDGDGDNYDFIEIAFQTAHEADPDARLIINDYSLESSNKKASEMYNLVKALLEEGIPVDGIGLQMHVDYSVNVNNVRKNMENLAKLREIDPDFVLEVTELDMSCFRWSDQAKEKEFTEEFAAVFDEKYAQLFQLFMELAEEGILDTVVFWGYYDGGTWLNGFPVEGRTNHPLLIDREMKFKSAYWRIYNLPEEREQ